jgi:hypothetical protein
LQSWFSYFTSAQVEQESKGKIKPLTPAEACGFIGCIIVETGRPNLDRLDVIEAGSGAGRGAMQYTGVRRTAYDKARSAAIAKGVDPNSNRWQQQYFAEEYAGLHDPAAGSLIGWTRIFENRPAGMTPAQAAEYWTGSAATATGYFRPGVPHLDRRQKEAQRVWGLVQSKRLSLPQKPVTPTVTTAAKPTGVVVPAGEATRAAPSDKQPEKPKPAFPPRALNLTWQSQLDNVSKTGSRECFSSSMAMIAMYWKKVKNDDEYNKIRARYGDTTNANAQVSALRSLSLNAQFITNASAEMVKQEIIAGRPVGVGWLHHGHVQKPSGSGHWSVISGFDETHWIVEDPNGEADLVDGGYTPSKNGAKRRYSFKHFNPRFLVKGPNDGWIMKVAAS